MVRTNEEASSMRFRALAIAVVFALHLASVAADQKPAGAAAPAAAPSATAKPAPTAVPSATAKPAPTAVPAPAKPVAVVSVAGKVTGPDAKPIAGATVRAIPMPSRNDAPRGARVEVAKAVVGKSDAAGAFKLDGLDGSTFALQVSAAGFGPTVVNDVPAGATVNLRVKPGMTVIGRVVDLTSQKPIANATVTGLEKDAARFGRDAAHNVKSAEDGTFVLIDCAAGIVVVEAFAPGKARARLDRVVAKPAVPGEERNPDAYTLYLQPGGRIAGRVLGPNGKPIADAIVTATSSDGNLFAMFREGRGAQRTDVDGKFSFDGIPAANKYTVRATKDGLAAADEGPIAVEAGTDRADLELKLEAGATLAFRLVTAQDAPVKAVEARVQAQSAGRRRGSVFGGTDVEPDKIVSLGDGRFQLKALDTGTFDVTLQPPDFADVTREGVKLKSGETTDLGTIRVKESKSIAGRVTNAIGHPVANASISGLWLAGEARLSREAKTGADGRYRLSGLGDQPLRNLTVRAVGYADASREGAIPGDTAVDFTLEKTGSIIGKVLLRRGSVPQAFRVQAYPEASEKQERPGFRIVIGNRPEEDQVFTDPSGNFRLDGIAPGVVTVTATSDGKAPGRKTGVTVLSDQIADAGTITLEEGRALRGRVVAAKDDSPIVGATVSVAPPQGFMMSAGANTVSGMAITGLDGQFEIGGLEARTYGIDATQPDYSPNSGRIEMGADADTDDFVIKLSRGGTITGVVRDGQKQLQVNAQILLTKIPMGGGPQTVSTGADGRYSFEKITPGEYMVMRAPSGGGPLMLIGGMKQVVVREGETTVHDLDESSKINLTGRVLRGGQPVGSAMLFFTSSDAGGATTDIKQSRTDADGRYQIGLDAAGAYSVVVASGGAMFGGRQSGVPIQVPDQPNPVVDVTVKAAGISGRVLNGEGKPVSGAMVSVQSTAAAGGGDGHGRGGMRDQSESDGTFLIEGLEPGTYALTVSAAGYRNAEAPPVTVANDSDVPAVEVRLEPGRTVRGRVLDANGMGIAGAMVMTAPAGAAPSGSGPSVATDVNGTFVITAPGDGPIDLTAIAQGVPPARAMAVQPQEGVDMVVRAPRPGHVRLTVVDPNGSLVAGAKVTCRAVPDYLGSRFANQQQTTGADGVTVVGSLAPGGYELTVTAGTRHATATATLPEGGEVAQMVSLP
jgi:protocatechuate 3,4-dioxygenase beta subunit